jgi:hypothetical protein
MLRATVKLNLYSVKIVTIKISYDKSFERNQNEPSHRQAQAGKGSGRTAGQPAP